MENEIVKYHTDHGEVTLSSDTIKRYLVPSGTNVTDQEVMMFMKLCEYQGLNPFLREVYLVKYGDYPASIVTGKETFTKRAMKNEAYAGMEAGITVITAGGKIDRREGSLKLADERLIGGWAKVYVKGHSVPYYDEVSFEEYAATKKDGTLNGMWATKPATMIRKVAIVHALREAFPQDFEGLYSPEEINTVDASALPEKAVVIPVEPVTNATPVDEDVEPERQEWVERAKTAEPVVVPRVVEQPSVRPNADWVMVKAGVNHKLAGLALKDIPEKTLWAIANKPVDPADKWAKKQMETNEKILTYLHWKPADNDDMKNIPLPFDLD